MDKKMGKTMQTTKPTELAEPPRKIIVGGKWEAPDGKIWKVALVQHSRTAVTLEAAGGGAVGVLTLARKSMRGWKEVE